MRKVLDLTDQADAARRAAAAAASNARGTQSLTTLGNREKKLIAELRDIERKLEGYTNNRGDMFSAATGTYRDRLLLRQLEAQDELTLTQQMLERARSEGGMKEYSRQNVKPGDIVIVGGRGREVVRANKSTASVKTGYSWTDKVPYHSITGLIPKEKVDAVRDETLSTANPNTPEPSIRARRTLTFSDHEANASKMQREDATTLPGKRDGMLL